MTTEEAVRRIGDESAGVETTAVEWAANDVISTCDVDAARWMQQAVAAATDGATYLAARLVVRSATRAVSMSHARRRGGGA